MITGRRTGKRTVRDVPPRDSLPLKKRAAAAAAEPSDGEDSDEEGAEVALMRMR